LLGFLSAPAFAFNSSLKLKVYERRSGDEPDRVLGFTPARTDKPISVPPERIWYVRPIGALTEPALQQLAREIQQKHIPGLDLSDHWELADKGFSHFDNLTVLRFLDISRTRLTDASMPVVHSLTCLTILMLPPKVTDQGLAAVQGLSQLTELTLDRSEVSSAGLKSLAAFSHLGSLDISDTMLRDSDLAELRNLPRLRRIVLNGLITDAGAVQLAQIQTLEEIDLSQSQIGDQGIPALAGLPHLRVLYANKKMDDAGLRSLAKNRSLQSLDLSGASVTDKGMESLSTMNSLKELALSQTAVGNKSLPFLAQLPQLRVLELSDTQVSRAGLAPLVRARSLKVLSLSWDTLSREDLAGMAKLVQLRTIILNGVPLSETTMAKLRQLNREVWAPVNSIEGARLKLVLAEDSIEARALAAPVASPRAGIPTVRAIPEAPAGYTSPKVLSESLPAHPLVSGETQTPLKIASIPKTGLPIQRPVAGPADNLSLQTQPLERAKVERVLPSTSSVLHVKPLQPAKSKARGLETPGVPSSNQPVEGSVRKPVLPADLKQTEDDLLKVIALKSRPSRRSFSGLAEMRELCDAKGDALSDIALEKEQGAIKMREDRPENSLGEIEINATSSRSRSRRGNRK
jgi:Leucine-rich repeat (LRR) protein